jgi:hypothetical protein
MKALLLSLPVSVLVLIVAANAQTNFLYDQQSAVENTGGGGATTIQSVRKSVNRLRRSSPPSILFA